MNNQEAKRHHYIPQFILKKFYDENEKVKYYNIETKILDSKITKNIFMNMHMYRDEINHKDNPTIIESTLAKFESEIAELFNDKFYNSDEIRINRAELEKIRIFLGLLSFRSDYRLDQYKNKTFDEQTLKILSNYVKNDDYEDLWKREICELAKMRSFDEIKNNNLIDPIIKSDFNQLLSGYYMSIVDARGGEFLITDVYPTLEICPLVNRVNINLHYFYPISPNRMIVLNHIMFKKDLNNNVDSNSLLKQMKKFSEIRGNILKQPKQQLSHKGLYNVDDIFIYNPQKIYSNDLEYINSLFLNEARIGILFKNSDKIIESLNHFNERNDTKQKFIELENIIKK